jgi:hypothetical protein
MANDELEPPPASPQSKQTPLTRNWPLLVLILILLIIVFIFHRDFAHPRAWFVFVMAAALIWGTGEKFFPGGVMPEDPKAVRFVIAFDTVVFIAVGLAAAVLACNHWEIALLLSGACLLLGGFVGLLFGYPQGVAEQNKQQLVQGQGNAQAPSRDKTLLAESAATLGKLITGFTLAKLGDASQKYSDLCHAIGPALGVDAATNSIVAGVIMAYFLATGFLAGLLLPSYFMSDIF